jgi:1-acyl-sn-glycerol-3-phosphate acyltransferase
VRLLLRKLASFLVRILIDVEVEGEENFPTTGPYIVIGNHVSALEPILMVIYTPHQLEYLGTGDIPIDPRMSFIANLYKFIPIMRGQIDQFGLNSALDVLNQKGVLGIFPEGGIWEKSLKEPKIGLSWISFKSKAPIVPIGFTGMNGALKNALQLGRPKVVVKIGNVLTSDLIFPDNLPLKQTMQIGADKIMEKISDLLPSEELNDPMQNNQIDLNYFFVLDDGVEEKFEFVDQKFVSKLIEHPVIMDVFARNLKLPVKALLKRDKTVDKNDLIIGINSIIEYLKTNPGFLNYRFGIDTGLSMQNGLIEFYNYLSDHKNLHYKIIIHPYMQILRN